ncbi:MAG: PAS domain-containing sensor histidine kinase [Saprospiraceae bacterium]
MTYQTDGSKQYRIERAQFVDRGFNREFVIIEDLSQEILDAEKRAYEKVIRMMAHEVNNSIGAINSIIESNIDYQQELDDPFAPEMSNALRIAKERNDRLNVFMRNFADIIRLPQPTKEFVDIARSLKDTAQLMRAYAEQRRVAIEIIPTDFHVKINLDQRQIEQVLVNVIKNAVEAIGEDGTIKIELQTRPNQLIISDNGKGISDEQAAQLFTPFYSDKPHGQGIGLTLTREILLNHGFEFSLKTVGEWTNFTVKF